MKRFLCVGLAAASICAASPKPAAAGGGGFVFGTILGLGIGTVVGSAVARPYYPYNYYPYAYYPYSYYPYAVPYAYPYPPPVTYAVPPAAYAPPGYPAAWPAPPPAGAANYASPGAPRLPAAQSLACRPGQFFNTLTGNCDRR